MGAAIPVIQVVAAVVGAGAAAYSAKKQKDAAAQAADNAKKEAEELARKTQIQQKQTESLARAKAAASGAQGGSVDAYLSDMEAQHKKELQWIAKAGSSQASALTTGGSAAAAGSYGSAASSLSSAAASVPSSWWS